MSSPAHITCKGVSPCLSSLIFKVVHGVPGFCIHRESLWRGEEPLSFKPDRWLVMPQGGGEPQLTYSAQYAHAPAGGGAASSATAGSSDASASGMCSGRGCKGGGQSMKADLHCWALPGKRTSDTLQCHVVAAPGEMAWFNPDYLL
jgi:hypothetical protein